MSVIVNKIYFCTKLADKMREYANIGRKISYYSKDLNISTTPLMSRHNDIEVEIGHLLVMAEEFLTKQEYREMMSHPSIQLEAKDAYAYRYNFLRYLFQCVQEDDGE